MNTKVLTAHVPLPLAERVDQMAARLERSRGWIMKQALSAWIDQEEERSRLTQEALADVDAGRVIDHQAVQAWADSLSTDNPLPVPR
jgi:predicted transcriptional regulator